MSYPWPSTSKRHARRAESWQRPASLPRSAPGGRNLVFESLESRVLLAGEVGIPPPDLNEIMVDSASPVAGTVDSDRYEFAADGSTWDGKQIADAGGTDDTLDFSSASSDLTFEISATGITVTDADGNSVTATGIEHLIGGQGDDRFVFVGDTALPGTIRGGDGTDTLDYSQYTGPGGADAVSVDLAIGTATAVNGDDTPLSVVSIENVVAPVGGLTADAGRADNRLVGGEGNDTLRGGAGDDLYVFADQWGVDAVRDLTSADSDTLDFSGVTASLTFTAGTVDGAPGWTVQDGAGATLDANNVEVLIGGSGDDTFSGGGTATVYRFGNDWGTDNVSGGAGSETLDFSRVTTDLTFVIDTTEVTVTDANGNRVTATDIENLIGGQANNTFRVLQGAALPGTIRGSFGGRNTLDYSSWTDPVSVDLSLASATAINGGIRGGVLNIQNVIGGNGGNTLVGDAFGNELVGGDGPDTLRGGAGDDLLRGGLGVDSYDGGDGTDTVSFGADTAIDDDEAVTVDLVADTALLSSGDVEPLLNIENVIGSRFQDLLTGDAGDNVFDGGGADDTIDGGGGNDTVSYRDAAGPVTVDLAAGTATVADLANPPSVLETDTLTSIENVIGTGFGKAAGLGDQLTGNADPNRFFVSAGAAATIDGGTGGGDALVIDARGAAPDLTALAVTYSNVASVRVQNTQTAVAQQGVQELGLGLQTLATRIEQLESLGAFGLGIPLADPGGQSFGALLGFSKVLRRLSGDFDKAFQSNGQYRGADTKELRDFFAQWSTDLRATLEGTPDAESTRDWLARTLAVTDALVIDPISGAVTELAFDLKLTNARATFMDLGESQFLNDAGVFVTRGQGFELTSGFNVDLSFGLQSLASLDDLNNWTSQQGSFFIEAGDRFKVTAFASLRDQLPVTLGELASRIGFMGGSVGGAGSELRTLNAGAEAQLSGSGNTRLTRQQLDSALFDMLPGATGLLDGDLPFDTAAGFGGAAADVGDGAIGLGAGANFLATQLAVTDLPGASGDFTFATAAELLRMLGQLGDWLGALSTSDVLDLPIPFAGSTTLGDALDFGQAFGEEMLRYLTQHDGLRLGSAAAETGRLSDDPTDTRLVTFTLAVATPDGERPIAVTLRAGATALNTTAEELRAQVEQALVNSVLPAQRTLAENIEVVLSEGRLVFLPGLGQSAVTGVSLPLIGNESLGFDGHHLIVPRSLLTTDVFDRDYIGTLGHDLEFTLNVDGTSLTVDVTRDDTNGTLDDLLDDINAAVSAAVAEANASGTLASDVTVTAALVVGTTNQIGFTATDGAGRAVQTLLTAVRETAVLIPDRLSLGVETATFPTAQLLAEQLEDILNRFLGGTPLTVNFDVPTHEMSLTVKLSRHVDLASIPLDLGVDLGDFISIDAATDLGASADVALAFTFGVNLFPHQELVVAPPVFTPSLPQDGHLTGDARFGFTLFEQNFSADQRLSGGPLAVDEFAITVGGSAASVAWTAPADGRLVDANGDPRADQRFFLRIGGGSGADQFVSGVLLSHDTLGNTSVADLADDLAAAIQVALASNGFPGISIAIAAPTASGFELSAGGAFTGRSITLVTPDEFRVAIVSAVSVAPDQSNLTVDDLVADVQAAIDAALANAGLGPVADPLLGLDGTVAINDLAGGGVPVVGSLDVPQDGVLTRDVRFKIVVDGGNAITGIVRAADTQTNASAPDDPVAALARDVENAINVALDAAGAGSARIEVRAHPPLGVGSLTLSPGVELGATSAVPEDGVLRHDVVFSLTLGGTTVDGAVRAEAMKNNATRADLAADVAAALNAALRNAGGSGATIAVDVDADGRLLFTLVGTAQVVTVDFGRTPARQLEFAARDANVELTFESPQVVAARTGNRISLTALPSLEQPDAGSTPLVVSRRIGITIDDFTNSAYAELGLLSSPVPFDGRLTSDATFTVVVDGTPVDVTVSAQDTDGTRPNTEANQSVDDLISDINAALTAAFGSDRVQARRVSLAQAIFSGSNRFEFYTKDTSIQRIALPALADDSGNAAITQLGFSTLVEQSARVQTAEFFIRDATLDGTVTLSADGLTGSAIVGFGGAGGLGLGVEFEGRGSVVGNVALALVNPDPTQGTRITLESLWKQIGNPSLELRDLVQADVTGVVDVDLLAQPVLLGRTPLEPITVALDLDIEDWLDAPPALEDASAPNGVAVSVTGLDLSAYDTLSHLKFGDVVDALDHVLDFLVDLQGQDGSLARILGRPLPLLNQSPNDLLVVADQFATLVDDVAANPARSLKALEHTLENLLGVPDEFVTLSLDTQDGLALRVDLLFDASVDASLGFDLDLRDLVALTDPGSAARTFLEGLTHFVGVSSTGDLSVGAEGKVRLSFGIALGDGNGSAEALGFKDGASGVGTLTATGDAQAAADRLVDENVVFDLQVGTQTVRVSVSAGDQTRAPVEVDESTRLSELDRAPGTVAGSDFVVRLADGTEVAIDLDTLGADPTIGDVVAALDAAPGLSATFDSQTHAIVLTDASDAQTGSQAGVYVTLTQIPEFAAISFSLQVGLNAAPVPVNVPAATGVTRKQWLAQIEEAIRSALVDAGQLNPVADAVVAVAYNAIASGGQLTFQGTGDGFGERLKIFPGAVFSVSNATGSDAASALGLVTRLASTAVDSDGDRQIRGRELRTGEPADVGGFLADLQRGIDTALQGTGLPAVTAALLPPVSGSGVGRVELTTTAGTTLVIRSIDQGLRPFLYNGADGTTVRIDVRATGENLDFTAQVGPFGFFVEDGSATLGGFFAVTLADTGDADGRTYFSDDFEVTTSYGGDASASLPLYFPDASTPVNDVDNLMKISVPDLLAFLGTENSSGGFDRGTGSVTITTPDLTAFPTPTLIGMLSNPEFLIDGLDSILSSVQDALDGEVFGIDLPLVGDKLAPAGQFVGDFRDDVLGYLSLKLRQGGLNPVTLVQETLYNVFADQHDGDPAAVEVLGFTPGAEASGVLQAGAVLTSGALARDAAFNVKVGRGDPVRVVLRAEDVAGDTAQALVDALNDSLRGRGLDDRLTAGYTTVAGGGFLLTLTATAAADIVRIDTAGAIPLDLFGVSVGGLGFLNDVAGPSGLGADGVIDVNDIVKSGFGLFDDFGQFDFLLGDHYVFNQPLNFDLGLPILEFDLDAGVQVGIGWQFAFGFGVSQEDGFYFVTDSDLTQGTANELTVDIDVGLLGVLGYTPGASAVADPTADRTVLTAAAELPSDGRLSRDLTFSLEVAGTLLADIKVTAAATSGNTTRSQLAANIEAAIDAALTGHGLDPNLVTAALHVDAEGHATGLLELSAAGAGTTLTIFDRATAFGRLGFLALDVLDGGRGNSGLTLADLRSREYTRLGLEFAIDLRDPNADDDRLSFAEMSASSTSLSDILVAEASGNAMVNLGLVVSFDGFGLNAAMLPAIGTDLFIDWSLGFSTAGGADIGTPDVQFRDITLDLGSFITDFAGPFLGSLADVLSPLDFLLDRNTGLLYQRLPVISDLAGETITLLRLAELLDTNNKVVPFIQAVEQVYYLANLVSDAAAEARANGGSILIEFGTITLDDLGSVDSLENSHPDTSGLNSNAVGDFNSGSSSATSTRNFTRTVTRPGPGSVTFNILQPGTIVDLLLGKPDVALVTYDLPEFGFNFEYLQRFPIYPPLFATLRGAFSATIDLAFGFDTLGLSQFKVSDNPLDLFNGFFVDDLRDGVDIPEVTLDGTIAAGASLDIGVASAGVEGGINALIFFNLNDPNLDGRVRLSEMLGNLLINSYNPLAVFDTSGRFDAFLRAYVEVLFGLWSKEYEIARVTLASFDIPFNRIPLLASDTGNGVLELNVGTAAASRIHGSLLDGNDTIYARYANGSVYVSSPGVAEQRYIGVKKIVVDGGVGNDTIDLRGLANSGLEIEIHGGTGNDVLYGASGTATTIYGDEGDDRIYGGSRGDTLDGGAGNDVIEGGDGDDTLVGGDGNDRLDGGAGNDRIDGGAGDDVLDGGAGDDAYVFANNWGQDRVVESTTTSAGNGGRDTWDFGKVSTDLSVALGNDPHIGSVQNVEITADGELRITVPRHGLRTGDQVSLAGIGLETTSGIVTLRGSAVVTVEPGDLDSFFVRLPGLPAGAAPVASTGVVQLARTALDVAAVLSADDTDPAAAIQIETAQRHGLQSGDVVRLGGVDPATGRAVVDSSKTYVVTVVDPHRFNLDDTQFAGTPPLLPGAFVQRAVGGTGLVAEIEVAAGIVTVRAAEHGLAVGDEIALFGFDGAEGIFNGKYVVGSVAADGGSFTLDAGKLDGVALSGVADGVVDGGVGVWQLNETRVSTLGSSVTSNGYGIETIRGGRGGDRFDTYQTGAEQIVFDGAGGSDTYVAHAANPRSGAGVTSDVRIFDTGDFWDTDKAVFLGSQGDDQFVVDQIAVTAPAGSDGPDSRFRYGEPDVVLGFESGASGTGLLVGAEPLSSGALDRAARMIVTVGDGDSVLVVVEPDDVGGNRTVADLVAALNAALAGAGLDAQLVASAVPDSVAGFHVALTAVDPAASVTVDNVSQGSGVEAFEIDARAGDDAIAVVGTNPRTSVHVVGGLGDDVVTIGGPAEGGPAVTLGAIRGSVLTGALVVDGSAGTDTLLVTDADDPVGRTGRLDERAISGLGMQIDIEYLGFENLGLQLGRGADAFVVANTPIPVVAIAAGDGDDAVTVEAVRGVLGVAGEAGADTLTLEASDVGSRTTLAGGAGADTVHVRTMAGDVDVRGGDGDDTINVGSGAGAGVAGTVNSINAALDVSGGAGLDTLNVDDAGDGGDTLTAAAPIDAGVAEHGRLRGDAHFGLDFGDGEPPIDVTVAAKVGVLTAASAVPTGVGANGQLSGDAAFTLVLPGQQIDVVVKRDATNASIADLLDDLNDALEFAGIAAARIEARYDESTGRFSLVSKQGESLDIRVRAGDPATADLGFADRTSAVFDNQGPDDLEADINDALGRAGVASRVTASIDNGRLSLTLAGGDSLLVTVARGDPAAADLGLVDGQLLQPNNIATLRVNPATARAELTGLGMGATGGGGPGITFDTMGRVNIGLGSGNDQFNVLGTLNDEAPQLQSVTTIDMGAGNDLILVSDAAPGREPGRGFLDGTLDAIHGELFIAAGSGNNTLEVSDFASTAGDSGVTITASTITGLAPAPIHYSATGRFGGGITILAGSGADRIRVESVLSDHVTSLHANAGDDDITIVDALAAPVGVAGAGVGVVAPNATDGLLVVYGEQGADRIDASGWHQGLVLFGDVGEVGFQGTDLHPANLVLAQTIEPQFFADDRLIGGWGNDLLFGGLGADAVAGGAGDDVVLGDAGRVRWEGGVLQIEATDLFRGGGDSLAGGAMTASAVLGGDGHDVIIGGAGYDVLYGTLAEDIMIFEYGRVTFVGGHATSVVVLGQRPLDLAASTLFDLYLKPPLEVASYTVSPREPTVPPVADAVNPVSTGGRAFAATHHQRVVQTIGLPEVQFGLGAAVLTSDADALLARVSALLADFPGAIVEIGGHTDSTGSAQFNQALSQMRAEAVRDALIERGVDPARLKAVGYGESRPVADNATEEGRAANRRVELTVVPATEAGARSSPQVGPEALGALGLQGWHTARLARTAAERRRRIDW